LSLKTNTTPNFVTKKKKTKLQCKNFAKRKGRLVLIRFDNARQVSNTPAPKNMKSVYPNIWLFLRDVRRQYFLFAGVVVLPRSFVCSCEFTRHTVLQFKILLLFVIAKNNTYRKTFGFFVTTKPSALLLFFSFFVKRCCFLHAFFFNGTGTYLKPVGPYKTY
jgi:hypothetical protein